LTAVVGLDYTPARDQGGGIGRYVRELVAALTRVDGETSYRLFVAGVSLPANLGDPPGANFSWHTTRLSTRWLARLWHRACLPIPVETWTGPLDLFHATDFVLPPVRHTTRTILTVHDLSFVRAPESASPRLKAYLDAVVPRSVRRADHVLADSQATKNDLAELYGTPVDKITVLLSGVDAHFHPVTDAIARKAVRERYSLGSWPFLFTVGTVQPRKNYARLCQALARLHELFPDLHLVIAGGRGWLEGPIYQAVDHLGLREHVHFIGFAADADLPVLYSMAEAVPYVSLYEGFGIPVLEAMACGAPVVASNGSSIPEVAGDAALLVDPLNVEAIADALRQVLESPTLRASLVEKGRAQVAHFTWENAARTLVKTYQAVLAH